MKCTDCGYEFEIGDKSKTLYNKTWRCWASKPTDEERAAAKWEV